VDKADGSSLIEVPCVVDIAFCYIYHMDVSVVLETLRLNAG